MICSVDDVDLRFSLTLVSAGSNLSLLCTHTIDDIQDVSVGLGLQVVRLVFYGSAFKLDSVPMSLNYFFPSGLDYALRTIQSTFT